MTTDEIKKAAADFQTEIADLKHYDTVQNAMLKKAREELKLEWPEVKVFSAEVHRLKFPGFVSPKVPVVPVAEDAAK